MSTDNGDVKVKMVRIQWTSKNELITCKNKVAVQILNDHQRKLMYLFIIADGKRVFTQEFSNLKWLIDSSANGVAAISSSSANIVILYDAHDESILNFFVSLQASLKNVLSEPRPISTDSTSSQSNEDSIVNNFIRSINTGSLNEAKRFVQHLAAEQVDVQFNIISKNDNQEKTMTTSPSKIINSESPDSALQLTLRIECLTNTDPITAPITVRYGTTLQALKKQIENETGIKGTNQYWFASGRYPISDEYVFGPPVSDVSNNRSSLNLNEQPSVLNPIRSGDTLIMYIAQVSSSH